MPSLQTVPAARTHILRSIEECNAKHNKQGNPRTSGDSMVGLKSRYTSLHLHLGQEEGSNMQQHLSWLQCRTHLCGIQTSPFLSLSQNHAAKHCHITCSSCLRPSSQDIPVTAAGSHEHQHSLRNGCSEGGTGGGSSMEVLASA